MSNKPGYGFEIAAAPDSAARVGRLTTPHGVVDTPAFIPVGTAGSVKSLTPDEVRELGAQITLANTYHLWLRPGHGVVRAMGGLHRFTGWDGPTLTDSGGFQVFSLGFGLEHGVGKIASMFPGQDGGPQPRPGKALCVIDDDGVWFSSHIDGRRLRLDPATSIAIQQALGADIILAFDECTSPLSSFEYTKKALDRTHRWSEACLRANEAGGQWLFGIVQGGEYRGLREESARFIDELAFEGYAIGGSLGKSKEDMLRVLDWTVPSSAGQPAPAPPGHRPSGRPLRRGRTGHRLIRLCHTHQVGKARDRLYARWQAQLARAPASPGGPPGRR